MTRARFTDPELQAIYVFLAPADTGAPTDTAEAIAAREGLDLAADLAAARRRTARAAASRRRSGREGRREDRRARLRWFGKPRKAIGPCGRRYGPDNLRE
ncbi:hypothetical protein ACF073_24000 [Streptomyces sp. NPDC015171]|uniref:hypothetical protein n=1 Tax=Streptomyces sp. NPDC015171 TaxID=3364945 RepID=UPI0036FCC647